jgi:hypothetical protein
MNTNTSTRTRINKKKGVLQMHLYMKHGMYNMTKFWDRNGGNNILAG